MTFGPKPSGPVNRRLAEDLMPNPLDGMAQIGRDMRQSPAGQERALQRQIEATKRDGLETGRDVKPRLLELRMRHRDLTGADGG